MRRRRHPSHDAPQLDIAASAYTYVYVYKPRTQAKIPGYRNELVLSRFWLRRVHPRRAPRRVCARPQAAVHRDYRRLARLDKRTGHEVLGRALHAAIAAVAAG